MLIHQEKRGFASGYGSSSGSSGGYGSSSSGSHSSGGYGSGSGGAAAIAQQAANQVNFKHQVNDE